LIKIAHIITGLGPGGAEMMLYKVLMKCNRTMFQPIVISLTDSGSFGKRIQDLNILVKVIRMRRGIPNPLAIFRLASMLRQIKPHIIQTWMYHANLMGGLAAKVAGKIPVVWGIHNSNLSYKHNKLTTIGTAVVCGNLSRWLPSRIVSVSELARTIHLKLGYSSEKMLVIPNGFDLDVFKPDSDARQSVRAELGVSEKDTLIGLIARFDPQKDHRNFIEAALLLHKRLPEAHYLLCGDGISIENKELNRWLKSSNNYRYFHLLGPRMDIPRLICALDILSSSSYGEAFPLVVGEAMACCIPCVVTDVGDSAWIVGKTGRVVPPKNPQAFADALFELLSMDKEEREELGKLARQRIAENFSLDSIVHKYEDLYQEILEVSKLN
jgi:glycosyltransferase involved in cell wall biosynthesis